MISNHYVLGQSKYVLVSLRWYKNANVNENVHQKTISPQSELEPAVYRSEREGTTTALLDPTKNEPIKKTI